MNPFRRSRRAEGEPRGGGAPEELTHEARVEVVRAYHRATCHDFHRYAAGPGWLDWANQPDPFRRYAGSELLVLDHADPEASAPYEAVWRAGGVAPRPLDRASLSEFLEFALGLSAWKEYQGSRWALRIDPSSGNLHPTEAQLALPAVPGLTEAPCIAHYAPREHALEQRARLPEELWRALAGELPAGSFLVALTSIHWREAWKYGERAYRYCQHDAGHALACLSLSAAALGWSARLAEGFGTEDLRALFGLRAVGHAEAEVPELLLAITPGPPSDAEPRPPGADEGARIEFRGAPNVLSDERVEWRAIELVAKACEKERSSPRAPSSAPRLAPAAPATPDAFASIARRRRSAVAMDGETRMAREAFYAMLARALPAAGARPFDALPWAPRVSLALFVHRVDGLEPGLYALARGEGHREALASEMRADFRWEHAPGAPDELPLFLLARSEVRRTAQAVSCHQEIASDGAFSLGMLAEFDRALAEEGASGYPRLYWECGAIGQVLYLEAEARGLRATGIGCFFDEPVHQTFGLRTTRWRSLYHFTVGGAVEDARLTSLAPYPPPESSPSGDSSSG